MNKAEIDAERINWLVKTFGEVSIGRKIDFLRWMDDREAVLVAALEAARTNFWHIYNGDWNTSKFPTPASFAKEAHDKVNHALEQYRGER